MEQVKPKAPSVAQQWYQNEFLPWQAKATAYRVEKAAQQARLKQHLPALQTMVGLLMEGQTRRAVMAWNALGLEPALAEIVLGKNGEDVLLRTKGGVAEHLTLDEVIAGLESLLAEPEGQAATPALAQPQS